MFQAVRNWTMLSPRELATIKSEIKKLEYAREPVRIPASGNWSTGGLKIRKCNWILAVSRSISPPNLRRGSRPNH